MKAKYLKFRKIFNFSPHPYDIGTGFPFSNRNADNQFLLKLYQLGEDEYKDYYGYHLDHNLKNQTVSEEDFFKKLWYLIANRINYLKQSTTPENGRLRAETIDKLQQFQECLNHIDRWNARPANLLIAEKDFLILYYKEENMKLKKQIAELNQFTY